MLPAPKSRGGASTKNKRKRLEPCRDTPDWPFELEELAAAALMVECARIDGEFTEEERDAICRGVMEEFVLDKESAKRLVGVAKLREDEVWHDWIFTETIKTRFDESEQLAVVGRLWEITLADGTVHPFEKHLIARVANELGIPKEAVNRRLSIALGRHPGLTSPRFDAANASASADGARAHGCETE